MKHVAKLTGLRELYVSHLPITDADARHLASLEKLLHLNLEMTKVTPGLLDKELKGCRIIYPK